MSLGKRISEVRKSTGFNKVEFGKLIGVSHAAVGMWEDGRTKALNYDLLLKIEQKTKYRPEWVATGKLPKKVGSGPPHKEIHEKIDRLSEDEILILEKLVDQFLKNAKNANIK